MIDKFEWKSPEKKALLDYVNKTTNMCARPIEDFQHEAIEITEIPIGQSSNRPRYTQLTNLTLTFVDRYNNGKLTGYFNYEDYLKDKEIQNLVNHLELNCEKFWLLILYIYDFCESICINGEDMTPSAFEQIQNMIDAIAPCVTSFDLENGSTLNKRIKMEIHIEGIKKPIIIDNPTAIHFIQDSCNERLNKEDWDQQKIMHYCEKSKEFKPMKDSIYIYFFATFFLHFFNRQKAIREKRKKGAKHSLKEMELVSRLIYFTKLSTNKAWLDIEDEYLKAYLKQYKDKGFEYRASNVYPSYLI